jgi:hypothetical protein
MAGRPKPKDVHVDLLAIDMETGRHWLDPVEKNRDKLDEIVERNRAKWVAEQKTKRDTAKASKSLRGFDPNEPRDEDGKWTDGGGGDAGAGGSVSAGEPVDPSTSDKLSKPEQDAITYYQGDGFSKINDSLRKGNAPGEYAKRLDSAIGKFKLIQPTTVFRGVGNTLSKQLADKWRDREPGDTPIIFQDKAFVSTSTSQKVAERFSKNTIKFILPKGHTALPITDRENSGEAEVLIARGSKFRVTNVRKTAAGNKHIEVEIMS